MAERVHCLYRVSTTKQVDHDELNQADIPVQRKACREFAKKMGWVIVGEEQETGVSGFKVSADDRDKLQLIKKQAEQGKFDILLVFMFDRLGRKSDETPFVVEWFVKHGVRVWSVNEGEQRFESHTDRLTNYIRYWQADGESQKTSIRTKTALTSLLALFGRYCFFPGFVLRKCAIVFFANSTIVPFKEIKSEYQNCTGKNDSNYRNDTTATSRVSATTKGAARILRTIISATSCKICLVYPPMIIITP